MARCLLADPLLLVLDEPMNGLDPAGIEEFREMISGFVGEGRTVFLSSHLLDEVQKTCDHVAIIDQGNILMQGLVEDIARGVAARAHGSAAIPRMPQRACSACILPSSTFDGRRRPHRGACNEPSSRTDNAVADLSGSWSKQGFRSFH